ncbi:MAG: ShlB/FhaC/HecB family hemolysin secretion/activation protein [Gammaproteobacteria bacterium]|nr:ShlB/FhaC/HecB family hemolysin secretion/activation protein [Gammaproteobacteria bacterium]MBQ0774269.1 ShlB/FhaC/HecB family hemolysin secretion/activation protein [Gammaproteobacteria bacterium]
MLGKNRFTHYGMQAVFLVGCLSASIATAAPNAQQRMFDRAQEQERQRQQYQLEEMQVPGDGPDLRVPVPEQESISKTDSCFTINTITFHTLDDQPLPFGRWLQKPANAVTGTCLRMQEIRALQAQLSNALIDRGYVTSRILIPEQDISTGTLTLLVVPGRIESFQATGMSNRILEWAVPEQQGEPVNLRGLEHAVETLARLPHLDAKMDLTPGTEQGGTIITGQAEWPRRYRGTMVIDEEYYGDIRHGTAQMGIDWGSPFGLTDRLSFSLNSDLDTELSDRAWGAGLNYDISYGYWNVALSYNRQQYENEIDGIFQSFETSGATDTSRLELTRTLYRSNRSRYSFSLLSAYSDTQNRLEDAVIRVSSYHLKAIGGRFSAKHLWGKTQLAGTLTVENGYGAGPATYLPGGLSIADKAHTRYQTFLTANRFIKPLYSTLSLRLTGQYSDDELFPSERLSIASSSMVRGYRDIALSGNSAVAGSVQCDFYPPITSPVSVTPFVAYDSGAVPGNHNEQEFARIDSATAGLNLGFRSLRFTTEVSWPMEQHSTELTDSEYVLHASLYAEF